MIMVISGKEAVFKGYKRSFYYSVLWCYIYEIYKLRIRSYKIYHAQNEPILQVLTLVKIVSAAL